MHRSILFPIALSIALASSAAAQIPRAITPSGLIPALVQGLVPSRPNAPVTPVTPATPAIGPARIPAAPLPAPIPRPAPILTEDDRSGPRLGMAYIAGGSVTAENEGKSMTPLTSVFGWQVEHQFPTGQRETPMPMTELVALVGGMEQGLFLPSVTVLAGVRKPNGWEAGIGPSITGAGVQIAAAAGITRSIGKVNVPINLAVAPGRRGAAISITTGFNTSPF